MKVNLNFPLLDLDGNSLKNEKDEEILVGSELAVHLVSDPHKDSGIEPLDALEYAIALKKGEPIDLTSSQQESFIKWVKNSPTMSSLFKGRILQYLKNCK